MSVLTQDKAIRAYWETVKDRYNIDFKVFEEVCKAPFNFVKHLMKQGDLYIISIKYFGKFKIFPSKLKNSIAKLEWSYKKGYLTQEEYEELRNKKLEQLNNIENDI